MAQTRSARSAIIAASVSANPRITHCKRDSDGCHRHQECRQDSRQARHQVSRRDCRQDCHQDGDQVSRRDCRQDCHQDRHQAWRLTAPTTRATLAERPSISGVTVARAGIAPAGSALTPAGGMGARSARALAASSSSAKTAVARRKCGSADRAASAAACAMAARVRRTGGTASAATRSLSVSESGACQTQRHRWQRSFRVQPLAGRRLAISTP